MKKYFLVLCLFFAFSAGIFCMRAGAVSIGTDEQAELLQTLGIYKADDYSVSDGDTLITRGAFISKVIRLIKAKDWCYTEETPAFTDVPKAHLHHDSILIASGLGIIYPDSSGRFCPDDPIECRDALLYLVRAMLHGSFRENGKDDIDGAVIKACRLKIASDADANGFLSRNAETAFLYNCLNVKRMVQENNDGRIHIRESAETLLTELYDANYTEGVVQADQYNAIGTVKADLNNIRVNGEQYEFYGRESYLGYYVRLYYSESENEKSVMAIYPVRNTVITLKNEDINGIDSNRISVYNENGKLKYYTFSVSGSVLYNGSFVSSKDDVKRLISDSETGETTLIDNNHDGAYEVCIISSYRNVLINSIDEKNEWIYTSSGEKIVAEDYEHFRLYDEEGNETEIGNLQVNNILSVYEPLTSEEPIIIYCSGITREITLKACNEVLTADDGLSYEVSKSNLFPIENFEAGTKYKVYCNFREEIVYAEKLGGKQKLVYLINFYISDDDTESIKYLSKTGGVRTDKLASRVSVRNKNGTWSRSVDKEKLKSMLSGTGGKILRQPIMVNLNAGGEINRIWLLAEDENVFFHKYETNVNTTGLGPQWHFRKAPSSFNSTYVVKRDAEVFAVPMSTEQNVSDKAYGAYSLSYFPDNEKWLMDRYFPTFIVMEENGLEADAVVWECDSTTVRTVKSDAFILTEIFMSYNEEAGTAMPRLRLYSLKDGNEVLPYYDGEENIITDQSDRLLGCGDIIRYELNPDGVTEKGKVKIMYSHENQKLIETIGGSQYRHDFNRLSQINIGKKSDKCIRGIVKAGLPGNEETTESFSLGSCNIIRVDLKHKQISREGSAFIREGDEPLLYAQEGILKSLIYYN
ncbi:MAG: hypothetical protein J6N52_12495 [Clostridia bacterium]|nr:hypothetical protein [Clostridia bacterium]